MNETYDEIANALTRANQRNGTRARQEDVRAAVVALRSSQFLFQSRSAGHYAILKSMRDVLEPHFELSGSRIVIDEGEGYIALVPVEDASRLALTVEETLMLLTLRWVFETKVSMHDVESDGSVSADEPALQQWYEQHTGREWPKRSVVKSSLDLFERRNVIQYSTDELGERVVLIRGVVRLVTGDGWVGRLREFLVGSGGDPSTLAIAPADGADPAVMAALTHDDVTGGEGK